MSAVPVAGQSTPGIETLFGGGLRARLLVGEEPVVFSPELVLVCPELRELALRQLPERDPDCFLPRPRLEQPTEHAGSTVTDSPWDEWDPAAWQLWVEASEDAGDSADPPLVLALLAYTVQQAVNVAVHGAALMAATAGLVVLLTQFHR